MKTAGTILLARARARDKSTPNFKLEEKITSDLKIRDVESEQKKYNNFWIGIQRRIAMQQSKVRFGMLQQHKGKAARKKKRYGVIHPLNDHKVTWDLVICVLVIYSVVMIPLRIGFNSQPSLGFAIFDRIIDFMFFFDMCATFNTAYLDRRLETYVFLRPLIAKNYLKFWFWVDLVSTIPWDDVVSLLATTPSGTNLSAVRAVRIFRLGRLAKLQRINKLSEYLEEKMGIGPSLMLLLVLLLQIFFVAHVFACFWHFLALPTNAHGRSWMTEGGFELETQRQQYIASLYYTIVTMLTVGYGDIHPTNVHERAFSVIMMLSGGVIFGALLSKVASVIEKRQPQARAFKENMDEVRAFLEEYHLPLNVKTKAKEAYSYYLTKKSSFGESGIFDDLPQPLLFRLVLQLYEKDIKKVHLFRTYECSFVVTLVINCKPFQAGHGDVIFNQGDVSKEIVFVPSGMVRLSVATGSGLQILCGFVTEGGFFGDMEYFRNTVITLAQYSAVCSSEFLSVPYTVLSQAISENLDSGTQFNKEVTKRYAAFVQVTKSAVLGDLLARDHARSHVTTPGKKIFGTVAGAATPRGGFGGAFSGRIAAVASGLSVKSMGGISTASQTPRRHSGIRRTSTAATHSSIWLNGHVRDHHESAHYIRVALMRHSTENLAGLPKRNSSGALSSEAGGRGRPGISPSSSSAALDRALGVGVAKDSDSSDSILTMLQHSENGGSSCRVLTKDEDGTQLVAEVTHKQLHDVWLIDPTERWKVQWDVFIAVIVVFTIIQTPIDIVFYATEQAYEVPLELALDGIFFVDILLSFRTTYVSDVEGALLIDQSAIAWRYFTTWFGIDFVSSIPYSVVLKGIVEGDSLQAVKLAKALRLIRLLKLIRVFKLEVFMGRLEDTLGLPRSVFELLQVLVQVFFVGHLVACLWWGVSDAISDQPWFTNPDMVFKDLRQASVGEKYLFSLYFTITTMTTVGYGDITATNPGERMLNIVIIVIGASVFGYIIANVSTILDSFSRVEAAQANRLIVIKEYLDEKDCPDSLQNKVVAHFKHLFSITSAYDVTKILSRLPPFLRDEILYFHNEVKMKKIPIFRHITNRSLALHIFNQLTPVFYEVDQYIIKQGRESGEISFLVVGTACAFRMDEPKETSTRRIPIRRSRQRGAALFGGMSTAEEAQYHRIRREFTSVDGASLPTAASAAGGGAQSSNNTKEPTDLNGEDDFNPGWAPGEATTSTSSQPKVSFNITSSEQKAVDRVVAFDDLNGDDDEPQPQQPRAAPVASSESVRYQQAHAPMIFMTPLRNRESFQGGAAGSILDMKDSPTNRMKSSPSGKFALPEKIGTLKEDERALRGLHLLGDFGPGDFFGHASLMKDTPHEHSIVATSACTVFVLSKAVIYKLIHAEPVVGLKLQEALGLAISAQAECLGQVHRRHNRAEFLRDLKDKVYELHHLDETGRRKLSRGGVASTLNAIAAEVESSSKGKAFFDSDSRKQHVAAINMGASPLRRQVSTMGVIKIKPRRRLPVEEVRGITSRVKMVKNARRFQSLRRHLSYKVGIVPASAVEEDDEKAMSVMRVPAHDKAAAAEVAKKIRRVEHVLSAQTILYESDVEDDKRAAKEQAIARMQELAGYGNVLSRRTTRETPRVKLQRLLRKALRQYKRDKARGLVNKRTHEVTGHGGDLQRLDHHRFTVQEYRQRITSGVTNFAHAHGPHMFGGAQALDEAPRRHSFSVMPSDEQADTFFQQAKGAPSHRKTDFDGHVHPASEKASGQPHHQPHHQDRPSSRWQASVRTVAFGLHAITSMHRHKVHLTRHELEKIKRRVDRNRRWSCSALEGLVCTQLQLQGSSGDAGNSSMMSAVARSWGSSAEDGQKAALRLRRQSFPSLENEVWRDAHTYEAVL